jgi:hypothetical protein
MMRLCATTVGVACLIFLAGCSAGLSGKPEKYQAGYAIGCRSGQVNAGRPGPLSWRDEALYRSDEQYTAGWNDGAKDCYAAEVANPHAWGGGGGR